MEHRCSLCGHKKQSQDLVAYTEYKMCTRCNRPRVHFAGLCNYCEHQFTLLLGDEDVKKTRR